MHLPGRTPEERARMVMDRINSMYATGRTIPSEREREELFKDITWAFRVMEHDGEARGRIKGSALAKLTPEERAALGL